MRLADSFVEVSDLGCLEPLRARGKISWTNMKKQGSEAPLLFHGLIHEKRQYPSVIVDFSAVPFIGLKGATLPWVQ